MRFYRVTCYIDGGNSNGFTWHTSMRDAIKERGKVSTDHPGEAEPEIEAVDIEPTKKGILRALSVYAVHPDNG